MDPPIPPTSSAIDGEEDWELYNDDGFVYHRKKRSRIAEAGETSKPPDPELDPVIEERNRRIRKKKTLLKLKSKYQSEIEQWEILSNSLNAMQDKADRFRTDTTQREERRLNANETAAFPEISSATEGAREFPGEDGFRPPSMLDELLFMAEAQETIIHEVTNLCEVAENISRIEEDERKQLFFDLPIWSSPRDLMASLCATD